MRQKIFVWNRFGLQLAAFSDGALFRPMNSHGDLAGEEEALSVGGGIRIVPTFLAQIAARFDAGMLLYPIERSFVQFGFRQYF